MEKNNKENYINRKTLVHMYFQIILKKKLIFKNNVQPKIFELITEYWLFHSVFFFLLEVHNTWSQRSEEGESSPVQSSVYSASADEFICSLGQTQKTNLLVTFIIHCVLDNDSCKNRIIYV